MRDPAYIIEQRERAGAVAAFVEHYGLSFETLAYTIPKAAEALSIPAYHIRRAIKAGELFPHRVGVRSILWAHDLHRWFLSHPEPHDRRKRRPL